MIDSLKVKIFCYLLYKVIQDINVKVYRNLNNFVHIIKLVLTDVVNSFQTF